VCQSRCISVTKRLGQRTRQAPRPGHWPCRARGRYHHFGDINVSIFIRLRKTSPSAAQLAFSCSRRMLLSMQELPPFVAKHFPKRSATYPTDRTRPVSARLFSSWTPRILCSRMDDTSVGDAFASAYVRLWRAETVGAAFRCRQLG